MTLRRTPMPRGTKPLERRTALAQVSPRRVEAAKAAGKPVKPALKTTIRPAVPTDVRAALTVRSGGWCEAALIACLGQATEAHHRITQKAGGRKGEAKAKHDRLSNLAHLCSVCHAWVTRRPTEAGELGLALKEYQVPAQEPVARRGEMVFLTDDGRIIAYEEGAA